MKKYKSNSKAFKLLLSERISHYGIDHLNEAEIMSVLTGIPIEKLNEFITEYGVINLGRLIDGLDITEVQKEKLAMVFEISRKIGGLEVLTKDNLNSSTRAGSYFVRLLAAKPIEEFIVTLLDTQNNLIKTVTMNKGTVNGTPVYPREVVRLALVNNATSVILAHNHPGGSSEPSHDDIEVTNKIKAAMDTVSIKVIDHVIVCGNTYVSFAEKGIL